MATKLDRPEGPILTWVFVGVIVIVVIFALAVFIYKYQVRRENVIKKRLQGYE